MKKIIKFLLLLIAAISISISADVPIRLDEVLPSQNETRVELGVNYFNAYSAYDTNSYIAARYGINEYVEVYGNVTNRNDFTLGLNVQLSPDNDTVALIGFTETSKNGTNMIGFTAYRSIDPVILSITTGYQNTKNDLNDLWFINPGVGFVVNNEVTFSAGLDMTLRQDNTKQTALELGLGYSINNQDTLSVKIQTDISDYTGTNIHLRWISKL